jgi:RNA-binding protein YhbY
MKLRATITNGKLDFTGDRTWVKNYIARLQDGDYEIEIKKYYKQRSLNQNAYYWSVVVQIVYEGLRDAGFDEIRNPEDAHNVLKEMFFKKIIHSDQKDNLAMVMSTTQFSTSEFEEKMDSIRQWAFEYLGIKIPLPNEQLNLYI